MTYFNNICADVGTVNCPCPLAETGDCLICSRLAGGDQCDCCWPGVCIYNEYIQNDRKVRERRRNSLVPVVKKIWYGNDLLVLVLKVSKGFALRASYPGSFVFLNCEGNSEFSNVPVSVMKADVENEELYLALKIISGKTKKISEAESSLMTRGVYRNGLLGRGLHDITDDVRAGGRRWLIITKGIGFAPAVNILMWSEGRVCIDMVIDTEKVNTEIITDYMNEHMDGCDNVHVKMEALSEFLISGQYCADDYDKVIILTSDYFINTISQKMDIPADKLIFSNNFRMCCGEGICGACSHIDEDGNVSKMCKCRRAFVENHKNLLTL